VPIEQPTRRQRRVRFYPDVPERFARTLLTDLAVLALLALFAWLGFKVHDAVAELAVLGRGVNEAGTAVQGGFDAAAASVEGIPVVGDEIAGAFTSAGAGTGGNVAALGERGEDAVSDLANLLGLVVFLVPALLALAIFLPPRVRQIRRLTAADRLVGRTDGQVTGERRRFLAMRAAFSLPYTTLARYTSDPFGDLAAERYDALVAAALDDAGLRASAPAAS
jgi:hypothetical protein